MDENEIRVVALSTALNLAKLTGYSITVEHLLENARKFEAFLIGEDATAEETAALAESEAA